MPVAVTVVFVIPMETYFFTLKLTKPIQITVITPEKFLHLIINLYKMGIAFFVLTGIVN